MSKIKVNGDETHPVYQFLRGSTQVSRIDWNFAKFLVDRRGNVRHFPSSVSPFEMRADIEAALQASA